MQSDVTRHHHHHHPRRRARVRAGAAEAGQEGRARGEVVGEVPAVASRAQVLLGRACELMKGCFPGAGRQSRWTAAAAIARRTQVPAQKVCAERASASPPGGAATGASANWPQSR